MKSESIVVRLTPDEMAWVKRQVQKDERSSCSYVIRQCVRQAMAISNTPSVRVEDLGVRKPPTSAVSQKKRKEGKTLAEVFREEDVLEGFPLTGKRCGVCKEPLYESPSGAVCKNGHGGPPEIEDLLSGLEPEAEFDPYG